MPADKRNRQTVGLILKKARNEKHLTAAKVADDLGIEVHKIFDVESGRSPVTYELASSFALYYKMNKKDRDNLISLSDDCDETAADNTSVCTKYDKSVADKKESCDNDNWFDCLPKYKQKLIKTIADTEMSKKQCRKIRKHIKKMHAKNTHCHYAVRGYDKDYDVYVVYGHYHTYEKAVMAAIDLIPALKEDKLVRTCSDGHKEPMDWLEIVDEANEDKVLLTVDPNDTPETVMWSTNICLP